MKRILVLLLCLLSIQVVTNAANDKQISFEKLPKQSQTLINTHFANQSIALVKMENEIFDKSYEVIFTDGNKIEFNKNGSWKEIDCKYSDVPQKLIPVAIQNHVKKNYPSIKINKIEKENRGGYEVSLANGLDLKFDSRFNLINIDN